MNRGKRAPLTKSEQMRRVKGSHTQIEKTFRRALWRDGIRYRLHVKILGKPDLVFLGHKVAVFIDGCFWHRCPDHYSPPKSNVDFWRCKIEKTVERDSFVNQQLLALGWRVVRFWEHEIEQDIDRCVRLMKQQLKQVNLQNNE